MPDLADLLERTTPRHLAPVDLDRLAAVARHRRRRARAAAGVGAAVAVLVSAALLMSMRTSHNDPSSVAGTSDLEGPAGRWVQLPDVPIGAGGRMVGAALSDGRVLVWGGDAQAPEGGIAGFDGAILDTGAGTWSPVPAAPLVAGTTVYWTQVSHDRLAVLGTDRHGSLQGAVLDAVTRSWTPLPQQDQIAVAIDAMAWNGETLALIRTSRGGRGFESSEVDWSVGAPVTLRWSLGEDHWSFGAPAPLALRFGSGVAFDGRRVAIVGGTTSVVEGAAAPASGHDPGVVGDGAIYDLVSDTWSFVPATAASTAIHPQAAWTIDGRLVLAGGIDRLADPSPEPRSVSAFDPTAGSWAALPEPWDRGFRSTNPWQRFVDGVPAVLVAGTSEPSEHPRYGFLTAEGWKAAPTNRILPFGERLLALSATSGNPGDMPFALAVRAAAGTWVPGVEAPFGNRMDPVLVVVGDRLVVVGGYETSHLDPTASAWSWVLEPSPTTHP